MRWTLRGVALGDAGRCRVGRVAAIGATLKVQSAILNLTAAAGRSLIASRQSPEEG